MCRIVNATRKDHRLRCRVEPTEGSVANIEAVLAGKLDAGFAQSDTQHHARTGEAAFAGRPQPKLRALFSVYRETFTLVARQDANLRTFDGPARQARRDRHARIGHARDDGSADERRTA